MLLIDWGNIVAVEENPVDTEGCAIAVDPLNKFIYWTEELPSVERPAKFNNKILFEVELGVIVTEKPVISTYEVEVVLKLSFLNVWTT